MSTFRLSCRWSSTKAVSELPETDAVTFCAFRRSWAPIPFDRGTFMDFPESVPTIAESLPTTAGMRTYRKISGQGAPSRDDSRGASEGEDSPDIRPLVLATEGISGYRPESGCGPVSRPYSGFAGHEASLVRRRRTLRFRVALLHRHETRSRLRPLRRRR